MKVLLDENVPQKLRAHLPNHQVSTVAFMGWGAMQNGELLKAAEDAGVEVFVTADKTLAYQQNIAGMKLAVVALSANNWPVIKNHVTRVAAAVDGAKAGAVTRVDCGAFVRARKNPRGPERS